VLRAFDTAPLAVESAAMAEPPRRFPPPWRVDKIPGGYIVRDANGQALACVYSRENEAGARQAKVLRSGRWRTHQRERTMQLSGSLPARRAKIRAMSSAVPMLLPPTNVRSPHTRTTVSQVLQACAGVTESAESIAIPSRAAVPSAEPIARVLDMFFCSPVGIKRAQCSLAFLESIQVAFFGL
jgi:hypothetical protein